MFVTYETRFVYNASRTCPSKILSEFPVLPSSNKRNNCWRSWGIRIPYRFQHISADRVSMDSNRYERYLIIQIDVNNKNICCNQAISVVVSGQIH